MLWLKKVSRLTVIFFAIALLFSANGCGKKSPTPAAQEPSPSAAPPELTGVELWYQQAREAIKQNDLPRAAELLEKVIVAKPDDPAPHMDLGKVYHQQKQYDKAEQQFREFLRLEPNGVQSVAVKALLLDLQNYRRQKKLLELP